MDLVFRGVTGRRAGSLQNIKYSNSAMFGVKFLNIPYDSQKPQAVTPMIVRLFLSNNPKPSRYLRHAFTTLLHASEMHWDRCHHRIIVHEYKPTEDWLKYRKLKFLARLGAQNETS